jgi:hypothetical protein
LNAGYYEAVDHRSQRAACISGPTVLQAEQYVGLYDGFEASFVDLTIRTGACGSVPPILLDEPDNAVPSSYIAIEEEEAQMEESRPDRYLKLYPNPAEDLLNFAFSEPFAQTGEMSIHVLNTFGRSVIYEARTMVRQGEIDISSLPSGLYLIGFEWSGGKAVSKFIKR